MQLQHFQEFAVLSQLKLLQKKSLKKKKVGKVEVYSKIS